MEQGRKTCRRGGRPVREREALIGAAMGRRRTEMAAVGLYMEEEPAEESEGEAGLVLPNGSPHLLCGFVQ